MKLDEKTRNDIELVSAARGSTNPEYLSAMQRLIDSCIVWELPRYYQELACTYIQAGLVNDSRYS